MKQNDNHQRLDLAAIRERLAGLRGQQYWRSLEELADSEAFAELLEREFPRQASGWMGPISRRSFLKLMGASLALAGLTGCAVEPREKIVPYVRGPDVIVVPGKPLYFATAMMLNSYAMGVLAESHMGRPTKIEGNPDHPASLGATDPFAQASVLTLYDPDRSQVVTNLGRISTWADFTAAMSATLDTLRQRQGAGLRILTETTTSPTFGAQMQALLTAFPQARWHQYEPIGFDNLRAGARLAFGEVVNTIYNFDKAATILALDADFLYTFPGSIPYARQFIDRRRVATGTSDMNRLYVVESTPTITGAMADHRLPMQATEIEGFARALAQALGVDVGAGGATAPQGVPAKWLQALAKDLQAQHGASIIVVGEAQPPVVHALAHAMNQALGNVGQTVLYTEPVEIEPADQLQSLRELVTDMAAGRVDTLVIIGGNPVLTAPADFEFAEQLAKIRLPINLSLYNDETAALCHWHIPETHYLETWSDARAFTGVASIIQPLIAPLYQNKSVHELLAVLLGQYGRSSYDIVREYWIGQPHAADFEAWWRKALNDGVIEGTAFPPRNVTLQPNFAAQQPQQPAAPGLEIIFKPDPHIWDGRFANNGWLQELPKPLTGLTWDNAALISPSTAQRLNLTNEELVDLTFRGRTLRVPIWIMPGHADESVTLYLGYGRTRAGKVGNDTGFNAYAIRPSEAPRFGTGLELRKTGGRYPLATTQDHYSIEGRELARELTLGQYLENPNFLHGDEPPFPTLYPEYAYKGNQWGMAIDLNACIGCNACTIACKAENNIPIVGKDQVLMNREMHWIKVDTYFKGDLDTPETLFQPRPCMHCEKAPCEVVCPTEATVHDDEGLNQMVYNRCIGTRYCSNNCPYKVRRFNFLQYADLGTPVLKLERNPEVTVRERGVMEKCTYCIQRIQTATIEAQKENRLIREGEVMTACQQVCPTNAIVFGNVNDPNSAVSKLKARPLNYGMLAELDTQPRTTYLARLRNPNPEIEG
jgi:molybdopterin-containing oxidoreductase family iron-sulfur binding subunit